MSLNEDEIQQINETLETQLHPNFNPSMIMNTVVSAGQPKPTLEELTREVIDRKCNMRLQTISRQQSALLRKVNDLSLEKINIVQDAVVSLLTGITGEHFTLHMSGGRKKRTSKRKSRRRYVRNRKRKTIKKNSWIL